jgi:hypothetical protein
LLVRRIRLACIEIIWGLVRGSSAYVPTRGAIRDGQRHVGSTVCVAIGTRRASARFGPSE